MECNKIKSLLSEYLDRTLQSDLNREVKEHLLSCKNCSKEFFLMKSIAGELDDLERIKAPNYLLNRVNQAITAPAWYEKILEFIPGSGGFKVPMEFVTVATTALLVFLIFSNIYMNKNGNVMVADSDRPEKTINNESRGPVRLDFIPSAKTKSGTLETSFSEGRSSGNTNTPDPLDMFKNDISVSHRDGLISDLREIAHWAGGEIVSREYDRDGRYIHAITVKLPLNSYDSFISRAQNIGRFIPPAPPLSHQSSNPVLLRISLNLSE